MRDLEATKSSMITKYKKIIGKEPENKTIEEKEKAFEMETLDAQIIRLRINTKKLEWLQENIFAEDLKQRKC